MIFRIHLGSFTYTSSLFWPFWTLHSPCNQLQSLVRIPFLITLPFEYVPHPHPFLKDFEIEFRSITLKVLNFGGIIFCNFRDFSSILFEKFCIRKMFQIHKIAKLNTCRVSESVFSSI